jgi:Na+/proline symporter
MLGSWRGYFLAQGRLSTSSVAATYIGANLTFTSIFLILSAESYRRGWVVLAIPIFWLVGSVLFVILYPRLKVHILEGRTLHQTLGYAFGSFSLQKWASFWTIIAFIGTVTLEFYGGIILINWTGVPLLASVTIALLLAYVVSAFTVSGGMRGVAYADIFLDLVSLATLVILARALLGKSYSDGSQFIANAGSTSDKVIFVISAAVLFIPFQFCTLDSWQRLLAWRKADSSPALWLLGGGILLALAYCAPIAVGVRVHDLGLVVPPGAHPLGEFVKWMNLGPPLLGVCLAGFAGAMLSTADELLNCSSLSLLFDFWQLPRGGEGVAEERLVVTGKFYTGVFGLLCAILALLALRFQRELGDMALAVFSAQVVFFWPLAVTIFTPRLAPMLKKPALLSMAIAGIVAVTLVIAGWLTEDQDLAAGAPVGAFVIAGILFVPPWVLAGLQRNKAGER